VNHEGVLVQTRKARVVTFVVVSGEQQRAKNIEIVNLKI